MDILCSKMERLVTAHYGGVAGEDDGTSGDDRINLIDLKQTNPYLHLWLTKNFCLK